ncbi:hypothetical protein BDV96DRAFT_613102 [Lophiotrema nucula]|uniref:Short-chain dehydrogenase n=1 Tax=Lophiotrema nucula TaxID=690887 RepID=A0A6A5Z5P3_9PLEO|nr:hypothetical protein BDV96DRAFT_613102 [Lophiotrema nucula]
MSRYAEVYKFENASGPGDARPTAEQIVKDEGLVDKLQDKTFLVTGVSGGIGTETLRALYLTGAHVYGTVRNVEKGQKVVDDILANNKSDGKIELIEIDLNSLDSVRKGAADFLKKSGGKLNLLINNAGIMAVPFGKTKDGFELQFGVDHLAHFLLFELVKDALLSSATPEYPSRVVNVASSGHKAARVRLDDYNFEKGDYNDWASYGQAKTANVWMANAIERKYGSKNLHATSLQPGFVVGTNLGAHLDPAGVSAMFDTPEWRKYAKNIEQGAACQVYAGLSEEWKHTGGKYLAEGVAQPPARKEGFNPDDDGYGPWAYDEAGEEKLWQDSLKFVGLA